MYRWTTPTNVFKTNIDLTGSRVYVTYSVYGETIIEKTNEDNITFASDRIKVPLTQQDTAQLGKDTKRTVQVQIRYVFPDGTAGASNIMEAPILDVLKQGEISYEPDE